MATPPRARAFSLIEAVAAVAIVGLLLVAALRALSSLAGLRLATAEHARGRAYADNLLGEVLTLPYNDPNQSSTTLGPESGEAKGTRALFDDADDYESWQGPPQSRAGVTLPSAANWSLSVTVEWVDPADLQSVMASDKGLKRITVKASHNERQRAVAVGYRSAAWDKANQFPPGTDPALITLTVGRLTLTIP